MAVAKPQVRDERARERAFWRRSRLSDRSRSVGAASVADQTAGLSQRGAAATKYRNPIGKETSR